MAAASRCSVRRQAELDALAEEIAQLEANEARSRRRSSGFNALAEIATGAGNPAARRKVIAYIDPVDIRFNRFEPQPLPNANAVMFCLMDVSGSMGEREKDLAKRFFVLLHLFLKRRYERIDIVFIRHTHEAHEVDEDTFFHSTQSGGTVVSTALEEMQRIILERYPSKDWNIYAAQASDGDNLAGDSEHCVNLLEPRVDETLPVLCLCRDPGRTRKRDIPINRQRHLALARLSSCRRELARISR